jgi:hypothetical protein
VSGQGHRAHHFPSRKCRPGLAAFPTPIALALLVLLAAAEARGGDFSVHSQTLGESYRIRGRDGLFSFPKTRLIQTLSLYGGHTWKPMLKEKPVPLKLSLNVNLLLDHDFGVSSREINPDFQERYIPLLQKTSFGFLRGYMHLSYGTFKRTDLRLGRQTAFDVTGMYAFDGIKAGFTWFGVASADLAYGFETIPMYNLAVMDFSPQGISWGSRDGLDEDVHPELTQPKLRPMLAATARMLVSRAGFLSLGYRRTYSDTDMDTLSFERLSFGFAMTATDSPLQGNVVASYDFVWDRISEINADTRLDLAPRWALRLGLLRYFPVFDASSIFNVFYFDPFNEVSLGVSFEPRDGFGILLSGLARQTQRESGETDGVFSDGGGSVNISFHEGIFHLSAGARMTDGESGTIAGLELNPRFHLLDEILIVRVGGGLWFFNDPLRRGHHSVSGGATTAAAWTITRGVQVTGSVNLYSNRISGLGLSTLWLLSIAL